MSFDGFCDNNDFHFDQSHSANLTIRRGLVAALLAVFKTLRTNPYGLNLLSSSPLDIESYLGGKTIVLVTMNCSLPKVLTVELPSAIL
jgi:hypothetical protein